MQVTKEGTENERKRREEPLKEESGGRQGGRQGRRMREGEMRKKEVDETEEENK